MEGWIYIGTPKDLKTAPDFVDKRGWQQSAPVFKLMLTLASCSLYNSSFIPSNLTEITAFLEKKKNKFFSI